MYGLCLTLKYIKTTFKKTNIFSYGRLGVFSSVSGFGEVCACATTTWRDRSWITQTFVNFSLAFYCNVSAHLLISFHTASITTRRCYGVTTYSGWWEVQSAYCSWKFLGYFDKKYTKDQPHIHLFSYLGVYFPPKP